MLPPGPKMSRAAQTAAWIARPGPFLFRAHREYGDVFTIRFGAEPPWVVLAHPDAVREVFTGDAAALHAGKANLVLLPFLGSSSVLLLDGPAHLRQRKVMLPPFHGARMAGYQEDVRRIAREHIARWPRDGALKLAPRLQAITLDVVLRVIFGVREHDAGLGELRDELVTLLVAGHETTATALAWAVERLVRTPGGWDRLRAGGEEYAEAAGKEALRLRPVLPVVLRHLQRDMKIAGHDLAAGTVVAPCIQLVHRRPDVYPEPDRFVPERFLGPEPQGGTYSWIPFGGGVRRCLR